jgi:hypothetical protein
VLGRAVAAGRSVTAGRSVRVNDLLFASVVGIFIWRKARVGIDLDIPLVEFTEEPVNPAPP